MTQFTTELLHFLAQKQDIDEFFRSSLETAMNDLLQAELSAFLGYEPYDKVGYNSGNSRNGTYSRKFEIIFDYLSFFYYLLIVLRFTVLNIF